jgi:hypothetical protein
MSTLSILYDLLDSFERGEHNGEPFVDQLSDEDLPAIAQCIKTLPDDEQRMVKIRLSNLIIGIEEHKNKMLIELNRIQEEILASKKNVKANVAYIQTSGLDSNQNSYH